MELKPFLVEYSADSLISMMRSRTGSFLGVLSCSSGSLSSEMSSEVAFSTSKSKGIEDAAFSCLLSLCCLISLGSFLQNPANKNPKDFPLYDTNLSVQTLNVYSARR